MTQVHSISPRPAARRPWRGIALSAVLAAMAAVASAAEGPPKPPGGPGGPGGPPAPAPRTVSQAPPESERVNTMQPFRDGDVFVAATIMNDPADDHAGVGRILQYDADLKPKGQLWLKGTTHKVGGLIFAPDGVLWAMAQLTPVVVEIAPDGTQKPVRKFSDRMYSSVAFGPDGSLYFGEHLKGKATGHPSVTTKFKLLPGRDVIGDGWIFRHAPDGKLLQTYKTETHGGMFGLHGVTSTVLADNGTRMVYISETGNRISQYDLVNDRQLPNLAEFNGDPRVPMLIQMMPGPKGELFISVASGFIIADPKTGAILRDYKIPGKPGWAAVAASPDGEHAFLGNFWDGDIIKMRLSDGAIVARANCGERESLSGIAQYPAFR